MVEKIVVLCLPAGTVGCRVFTLHDPMVVARIHIALLLMGVQVGGKTS